MDGSYHDSASLQASYSRLSIVPSHASSVTCMSPLENHGSSTCKSAISEYSPNFNWPTTNGDYETVPRVIGARSNTIATEHPTGEVKRKRGRPRKHPVLVKILNPDKPKGRSKTGCITCRRRKKKCDETKPTCPLSIDVESKIRRSLLTSGKVSTVRKTTLSVKDTKEPSSGSNFA